MKIVFMGTPDFGLPGLEKLHHSSHQVVAVVSGKDKPRGRGGKISPTKVKANALELNLPVIEVEDLKDPSFIHELESLHADLFVVVAFRILPPEVLTLPSKGTINLHASLLPKYRGAAPIHWAVMNGETRTGCTVFWVAQKMDTGNIISQHSISIGENETTGEVYSRLKESGGDLLAEAVESIADESYNSFEQDDTKATPAPKIFKDDCRINFHQPARQVHNRIRGLSPWPTAWGELDGQKFNMYQSKIGLSKSIKPGLLQMHNNQLLAGCEDGTVVLETVQLAGKRKMGGKEFMNGYSGEGQLK